MKKFYQKWISAVLTVAMAASLCAGLALPAAATSPLVVEYDLNVGGENVISANAGESILVNVTLRRTDAEEGFSVFGTQCEILYDTGFFEVVKAADVASSVVDTSFVRYFNSPMIKVTSMSKTFDDAETVVASFYMKPKASLPDGASASVYCVSSKVIDSNREDAASSSESLTVYIGGIPKPTCNVTYELSGGTMNPTAFPEIEAALEPGETPVYAVSVVQNEATTLPPAATREGYTFLGWSDGSNVYSAGASYTVTRETTFYASWKKYPSVTLNAAGGSLGSAKSKISGEPNSTVTLPEPTRVGYTFSGWSNGTSTYTDTYPLGTEDSALTAQWTLCAHPDFTYTTTSTSAWKHYEGTLQHYFTTYYEGTCSHCGQVLSKSEDKYENCDYQDTWVVNESEHYHICKDCGDIQHRAQHSFSSGYCAVCGYKDPNYTAPSGGNLGGGGSGSAPAIIEEKDLNKSEIGKAIQVSVVNRDVTATAERNLNGSVTIKAVDANGTPSLANSQGLTIETDAGSVSFDANALKTIAKSNGDGFTMTFSKLDASQLTESQKKAINGKTAYSVLSLNVTAGTQSIQNVNGKITIRSAVVPSGNQSGKDFVAYRITDAGKLELLSTKYPDGAVEFTAGECAGYAIVYDPAAAATMTGTFDDVRISAYYADAVEWAVQKGVTQGTSDTTFSPDLGCTRAQFVTFLWRAAGRPESSISNWLIDVDESNHKYYMDAILWALEQGITDGTNDEGTMFSPDAVVTRAQAVTFMQRYANGYSGTSSSFSDVPNGQYYTDAVNWAVANGITNGVSENKFGPDNSCTRAQMVVFLYRMFK